MANFSIIGRHALLFDDDAAANFVNSATALVPWGADPSLLIDRHDVRHLLDRVPLRPKPRYIYKSEEEVAEELVVDQERFLDLPSEDKLSPNETEETSKSQGAYAAVSFSYGSTEEDTKPGSELKPEGSSSCYRPPFPLPDSLLNNLPPSEKMHQIIARSAKFVSEHGGQSEIVLRVKQGNNPTFGFLLPDHHLHPYFRYLVENSNLLKTEANSDKGALSLLGSVYGSAEDEDEAITPLSNTHPTPKGMEIEKKAPKQDEKEPPLLTGEKPALAKKNPSIAKINPSIAKVKVKEGTENVGPAKSHVVMMEPSSVMKIAMEKIAEFIHRNGRELEAVLINQDRSTNNFPFLVPTNAYHPYYLKILEDAKERKKSPEKKAREPTPSSQTASREPSEEPQVPEKFKMEFGKTKKPEKTEATNQNLRAGLTTQEAAAIVRAATRGVSPSFRPEMSKSYLGQDKSGPGPTKPGGIDEDWIAKTIAKTAALVSSEAASVSKEEKIKAERLKRAKMFASMIKTGGASGGGPPLPQLLNKVDSSKVEDDKGSRSNEDDDGENSKREKLEKGRSETEKRHREKNYRKHGDFLEERERSEKRKSKYSDEETCEESSGHDKKRHNHRHHHEHRKRHHSSSDEEIERTERKRERHSYNNKEGHGRKRERSRHRKSYNLSDSEEEDRRYRQSHRDERRRSSERSKDERERSLSNERERSRHKKSYSSSDSEEEDRRYRQSHRDERRRSSSKRSKDERERSLSNGRERSRHKKSYSSSDSEEEDKRYRQSQRDERRRSSSKRSKDERERSLSNVGEKREDSADAPDELRAKIRAMLMETL